MGIKNIRLNNIVIPQFPFSESDRDNLIEGIGKYIDEDTLKTHVQLWWQKQKMGDLSPFYDNVLIFFENEVAPMILNTFLQNEFKHVNSNNSNSSNNSNNQHTIGYNDITEQMKLNFIVYCPIIELAKFKVK